jgi:hypothetical protein
LFNVVRRREVGNPGRRPPLFLHTRTAGQQLRMRRERGCSYESPITNHYDNAVFACCTRVHGLDCAMSSLSKKDRFIYDQQELKASKN